MSLFHSIRSWALVAVAVTSIALIAFAWWLIAMLSAPDWCGRAVMAARESERPESAIVACFGLLTRQTEALAINSHIAIGTLALCLAVLVVIVLAGGRLSFKWNRDGVEADVARDREPIRAGDEVTIEKE